MYEVMRHAFDVQRELGRLFHEKIYHREIAFRIPDARCEVAVDVRFGDFCKTYYLDLLVGGGAIFELKAVEALAERHRRQLMHYLFLADLPHGKLVNLRRGRSSTSSSTMSSHVPSGPPSRQLATVGTMTHR